VPFSARSAAAVDRNGVQLDGLVRHLIGQVEHGAPVALIAAAAVPLATGSR
jgi:hypothetical protein